LRATFVIGPDGVVAHVIPRVTPRMYDDEVLAVLEQLAGGVASLTDLCVRSGKTDKT